MSDSKKPVLPEGFTNVKEKMPVVKSHGPVASSSKLLVLFLHNGKLVTGYYQRWDRDVNAHILAKRGEGFFYDLEGTVLTNVVGYKTT